MRQICFFFFFLSPSLQHHHPHHYSHSEEYYTESSRGSDLSDIMEEDEEDLYSEMQLEEGRRRSINSHNTLKVHTDTPRNSRSQAQGTTDVGTIGGGRGVEGKVGLSDKFSLGSPDPVFAPLTQALLIHSKAELIGVALNNCTKQRKAELLSFLMSLQSILKPQMQPNRPRDASGWD